MSAVEAITEEVASNLEEAAVATRKLNAHVLSSFGGGLLVGAAVGGYFVYRWSKEKIRAEVLAEADKEIQDVREAYRRLYPQTVAPPKPSLQDVVEENGYVSPESDETPERPLRPPVPVDDIQAKPLGSAILTPGAPTGLSSVRAPDQWNYPYEQSKRSTDSPYVIHEDEHREGALGYSQASYTYYASDGILSDDEDQKQVDDWSIVGGMQNLKFGHGSSDPDIVFIRNDTLGLDIEVTQVDQSYAVAVLGLDDNDPES